MNKALAGFGFLLIFPVFAAANTGRGLEIAQQVEAADSGWGDELLKAVMTLRASNGHEVVRMLRTRTLEVAGDGDKSLTIFDQPRDIKGTVFLTHTRKQGNDDQWIFLPALKRVKRINSSNRSGPFMGSDFSYEDVTSEEVERYSYNFLQEASCGGNQNCYVYERFPENPDSGYTRQIVYVDSQYFRIHKIEYFDRKHNHQKTLERSDYQQYGDYWRASRWEMINHLRHKSTIIEWRDREFGTGLDQSDFNTNAIKRFR